MRKFIRFPINYFSTLLEMNYNIKTKSINQNDIFYELKKYENVEVFNNFKELYKYFTGEEYIEEYPDNDDWILRKLNIDENIDIIKVYSPETRKYVIIKLG